jgi:hypothetical protein
MTLALITAPRPRSGRLQGFSRDRNARERIPVLRKTGALALITTPRPRSGRLQGFSRDRNARERIPVLRKTLALMAKTE